MDKETCVILHLSHFQLWDEILWYLKNITTSWDLYITIPLLDQNSPSVQSYIQMMKQKNPQFQLDNSIESIQKLSKTIYTFKTDAIIMTVPNRGLDPGGFFRSIHEIFSRHRNYKYLIKIHSKLRDVEWRKDLWNALLISPDQYRHCINLFETNSSLGMIGSEKWIMTDPTTGINEKWVNYYRNKFRLSTQNRKFIAGTMFMMRFSLMKNILSQFNLMECINEMEEGYALDGLKAHALERIFGTIVYEQGYHISGIKILETK